MDSRAQQSRLLNRMRVRKHREKARVKVQSAVYLKSSSSTEGSVLERKSEETAGDVQPPFLENDVPALPMNHLNYGTEGLPTFSLKNVTCLETDSSESDTSSSDENENCENNSSTHNPSGNSPSVEVLIQNLRIWASENISNMKADSLLRILHPFHPEIPLSSKTLLKTNLHLNKLIKKINPNDPFDKAEMVYFGILRHLQKIVNPVLHLDGIIWLMFNIDGLPLYKSSSINLWITMCKIYHQLAKYKPFIVSAYSSGSKPASAEVYLDDFIQELDDLCENGVMIGEKKFEVKIKCFICDRPARSFVKCCTNHGGYYACERCWVEGTHYMDRRVYPVRDDKLRTDESFNNLENIEHHNGISPLTRLKKPISLVKLFIFDFMHLGFLGITKTLIKNHWFASDSKISREKQLRISLRLVNIANQIPVEFQRTTRSLSDISKWTAKEFRLILLYVGPFVFKDILDEDEYKHLLLLHVASRIICSKDLYKKFGPHAKLYFERFALLGEILYGLEFVSLTVHSLPHLIEDTINMDCPVTEVDAFPYENELRFVKKHIKSGYKPLAQVCKKVEKDLEITHEKVEIKPELQILKSKEVDGVTHVQKLIYKDFELSAKKPNDCIFMNDGSLIKIKDFISSSTRAQPNQVVILGARRQILGPADEYPTNSSHLGMYRVSEDDDPGIVQYSLADIKAKAVVFQIFELPSDSKESFAVPMLH